MSFLRRMLACVLVTGLAITAWADTGTLLLLYTNDLHDHARAGYEGRGGMPHVGGYVARRKAQRSDVLVVDAGDVMEKGDMVSHLTQSRVMYEAMGLIGFDVGVPGNHDFAYGLDHLRACGAVSGMDLVCVNIVDDSGRTLFPASKIFDINGLRVGVIGVTQDSGGSGALGLEESGRLLAAEAKRLAGDTHLIIATCHRSVSDCIAMSRVAPEVHVFVAGHRHEMLTEPHRVRETGAYVVIAGYYAQYVGALDLEVDLKKRQVVRAYNELVDLVHEEIPADPAVLELVTARERELCPEASHVVGVTERSVTRTGPAVLAAAALRAETGADIGFCHTGRVIRSGLPRGSLDVNALFRTGGQRGEQVFEYRAPGAVVAEYLVWLLRERRGRTSWSGFAAELGSSSEDYRVKRSTLEPEREYRIVMTGREEADLWKRYLADRKSTGDSAVSGPRKLDTTYIDAVTAYVEKLDGKPVDRHIDALEALQSALD